MAGNFDWNKYPAAKSSNSGFDWDSYPSEKLESKPGMVETAARFSAQGATGGMADEIYGGLRAIADDLTSGFREPKSQPQAQRDEFGRVSNADELNASGTYKQHRDEWREGDRKAREANPATAFAAEMAGGIVSPINKVTKGMSVVKGGATLGGLYGYGNSESDTLTGQLIDTAAGATVGAVGGKAAEKAAPHIERGIKKGAEALKSAKNKIGNAAKNAAEEWSFKSTGAMLKDWRNADDRGEVNKIGRWLLDKGLKAGQTVEDVAEIGAREKSSAAVILDDIYNKAGESLKGGGSGFDPIRDKERIMAAARSELGDTVGGEGVLNQLSGYIDDLAAKHGDAPNDALRKQFQADVNKYKTDYRNYLNERKDYQKAFGNAADEQQQVLNGFTDDSQRTARAVREVEVHGQPAEVMAPADYEYGTQMGLFELPQAPQGQFNPARGAEDLLPLQQKMAMDQRSGWAMRNLSDQGEIAGTGLVPRATREVEMPSVQATGDQLRMNFQPNAPTRPVAPEVVRNPMAPRRSNEIKGAFDDQINYSRNPLTNEPVKEKVYSGARRELNKIVLESIDSIDDKVLGDSLRATNADYGMASKVSRIANDRVQRESANKFFGLTDNITGVGGVVASLMTGTPLTGIAMIGVKKAADKYGASTTAVALDRLSKRLLREPQMQKLAQVNPQQFNATVIRLFETLDSRNQIQLPRAAENQTASSDEMPSPLPNPITHGPKRWMQVGSEKLVKAGLSPNQVEELGKTKAGQNLLIEASDASPDSVRMKSVIQRIRTATAQGGQ